MIASDHAGFNLKEKLKASLSDWEWEDVGPMDISQVDYPDYAHRLATRIVSGEFQHGILICGSGIGMCIAANKVAGIRAAVVENPVAARLSREHNDSNILCLGSRFIAPEYGVEIVKTWLTTPFNQEPRHLQRIEKIRLLEKKFLEKRES